MKKSAKIRSLFIGLALLCSLNLLFGQSIIDPSDPVLDPSSSIQLPPYGTIGKWVRRKKMPWNTNSFKAYVYNGRPFRVKFPRSYSPNAADSKKYPIYVFFHGFDEAGDVYDNEYQLYRGGQTFLNAVDSGKFDGYLLYMQSQGFFGPTEYQDIMQILDYMVIHNKVDPFRINLDGISAGAQAVWEMAESYPTYAASASPISNVSTKYGRLAYIDSVKFTPLWLFQGGQDLLPSPYTAHQVRDSFLKAGANFRYTEFPTQNHLCWDSAWGLRDYYQFLNDAYASNPWPLFNTRVYHTGDAAIVVGVPVGYDGYQWRRNGSLLPNEHQHTISVTAGGIYDARVKKGTLWSEWSRIPVKITGPEPHVANGTILPNPFHNSFTLTITAEQSSTLQFHVYDMNGRLVDQRQQQVSAGTNTITFHPNRVWQQGIYLMVMTEGSKKTIFKLLKQ